MRNIRNYPEFTHFACLPFKGEGERQQIYKLQAYIKEVMGSRYSKDCIAESSSNLAHITLTMLTLHRQDTKAKAREAFASIGKELFAILSPLRLSFSKISYFSRFNQRTRRK